MLNKEENLAGSLLESKNLIKFLVSELREIAVHQQEVKGTLSELRQDVSVLMKLVRDGNGVPPLLRRVDKLEERQKIALENVRGKWALAAASVAGFLGMIVALVALFK